MLTTDLPISDAICSIFFVVS